MVADTVKYLTSCGRRVIYDSEHFFDGYRADPQFALDTLRAALAGGAESVVLCDTNGGSLPWEVERSVGEVVRALGRPVAVHTHDDAGCGSPMRSRASARGPTRFRAR
jgi:2-isopropylmalate synthase